MVNFITSPISSLPLILRKQRSFFFLAMFGTAQMISTLCIPKLFFGATIQQSLYITSYSQAIYLVFVIFIILAYTKNWKKE
jgi:membrane protein DedA with SNARE-associated domain